MQLPLPDPSLVADHFHRAGDRRAVEWLVRAGSRAQRLYAWTVAVDLYEDALTLLEGDETRLSERGWICFRLGRVLCFRDAPKSHDYLDQAVRLGEMTGDELLSACATTQLGHRSGLDGDYQTALDLMSRGLAGFDRLLDERTNPAEGQPSVRFSEACDGGITRDTDHLGWRSRELRHCDGSCERRACSADERRECRRHEFDAPRFR